MTREEHAQRIRAAIDAAESDGFLVDVLNNCCGCSDMHIVIGTDDDWGRDDDGAGLLRILDKDDIR